MQCKVCLLGNEINFANADATGNVVQDPWHKGVCSIQVRNRERKMRPKNRICVCTITYKTNMIVVTEAWVRFEIDLTMICKYPSCFQSD